MIDEAEAAPVTREHKLYWWKEALIIAVFYLIYSFVRNQFGSALVDAGQEPVAAFDNAMRVIDVERLIGLYHEETIQAWFLPYSGFIQFWNTFYGTAHFIVTIAAFVWMYRARRDIFPRWRNALALTTALALIGFATFSLMPPRLLNDDGVYGGDRIAEEQGRGDFGFVDTLAEYGGPWSFDSGAVQKVSNQYAAMPSVHCAWALWCACALVPRLRHNWAKVLAAVYPVLTVTSIVITANHYVLDAVAGFLVLGIGFVLARAFTRAGRGDAVPARAPA